MSNSIQPSGPRIADFQRQAEAGEAVALKKGDLKSTSVTPAKVGFFGKIMQWIRGDSPSRINQATKDAFGAALAKAYGKTIAEAAMHQLRFDKGSDTALSSRAIQDLTGRAKELATLRDSAAQCKQNLQNLEQKRDLKIFGLEMKAEARGGTVPTFLKVQANAGISAAQEQAQAAADQYKEALFRRV